MATSKENNKSNIKEKKQLLNLFVYKYYNIFIIVIFLFVLILGYSFGLRVKYDDITKGVEQSNQDKREKLSNMKQYLSKLNRYRQEYYEINSANIEKLNKMLPAEGGAEELYSELELLVRQKGLALSLLQITPEERTTTARIKKTPGNSGIGEIKISMQVTGANYGAFKKFVYALENNLRLIDIASANYSPSDMSISIDAVTYYLK